MMDSLSLTTSHLKIWITHQDIAPVCVSTGTGFFYNFNGKTYLITNWHVVTGRHPETHEQLSDHAGIPNAIQIVKTFYDDGGMIAQKYYSFKLYFDEDQTQPVWFVHPDHKERIDVVAIELDDSFGQFNFNKSGRFNDEIKPKVTNDCFVIGYPLPDVKQHGQLPIWKRGSIASEPLIDVDGLPKMLIDTATRSGLSGSPVIFHKTIHSTYNTEHFENVPFSRTERNFLGVYSGRIGRDEQQAQLGVVWRAEVIPQILEGGLRGDVDFQTATSTAQND